MWINILGKATLTLIPDSCFNSSNRMANEPQNPSDPNQLILPGFPDGVFYINYYDGITESKVRGLMALCSEIMGKVIPVPETLSSPGGNVAAGITLYNFLRALPVEVVMHNVGSVDSIATVIFLAANRRFACQHSRFLFHGISTQLPQGASVSPTQVRELLSGQEQDEGRIKELLVERSQLTESEIVTLFRQGETKNPTFALEKGVIHDIRDLAIPKGAKIITANFQ
jgi:ATP-dependent protease ClpP protease subunit